MKRRVKGIVAGACAASMALAAAGCAPQGAVDPSELQPYDPSDEVIEAIYGPPPEYENIPIPDDPGYGTFDPSYNQNEDIYGPPEMFDAIDADGNLVRTEDFD